MEIDGKPVMNSKRKLRITITADDIDTARAKKGVKDPGACAAAQAILRQGNGKCKRARVHLNKTYILGESEEFWLRYQTPNSLRNEIIAFDRGGTFMPGAHELKAPDPKEVNGQHQAARVKKLKAGGKRQGSTKGDDTASVRTRQRRRKIARINVRVEGVRERGANR